MLKGFISQRPSDPFPRYALGMEYKNAGQLAQASEILEALIKSNPDYTATYLHAGNAAVGRGDVPRAREIYQAGIAECARSGDTHARGELEGALSGLPGPG